MAVLISDDTEKKRAIIGGRLDRAEIDPRSRYR